MKLKQEFYREKVKRYLSIGLSYSEIGKLLDVSSRTIQRYITATELKKELSEPKAIQKKAFELLSKGYSYSEVAKKLNVTKTTVYLWNRKRQQKASTPEMQAVENTIDTMLQDCKKQIATLENSERV